MLYISELCEDCAIANEIYYEIDDAWTNIHGIHDNGTRDHGVWRLTLTAYYLHKESGLSSVGLNAILFPRNSITTQLFYSCVVTWEPESFE